MKRVKKFGVYQTSKVAAIIMFAVSLIFLVPFGLIFSLTKGMTGNDFIGFPLGGSIYFILMPFLYGIIGFIMTAISCLIYNLIAKWTGGIELEFETVEETR